MPFILKHKSFGYSQFMKLKKSNGICFGLTANWILDFIEGKKTDLKPTSHLNSIAFEYQGVYERIGDMFGSNDQILEVIGKQMARHKDVTYQIHAPSSKFGLIDNNSRLKNNLINFPVNNGESALCLMSWCFDSGGAHAVALFKNGVDGSVYFYDPNDGVFQWKKLNSDLYQDIKTKLSDRSASRARLHTTLFVHCKRGLISAE